MSIIAIIAKKTDYNRSDNNNTNIRKAQLLIKSQAFFVFVLLLSDLLQSVFLAVIAVTDVYNRLFSGAGLFINNNKQFYIK